MKKSTVVSGIKIINDCEGQVIGKMLTVIGPRFTIGPTQFCVARCECGVFTVIRYHGKRDFASCGCKHPNATHGRRNTTEYHIWSSMKTRCECPNAQSFPRYGGRGIKICDRWRSFECFLADMGPRPSPDHSLDRIDNDGNYEPSNCKWSTTKEQSNNRHSSRYLAFYGKALSVTEWSEISQVKCATVFKRLEAGWNEKDAVWTPTIKATEIAT